MVRKGIIQIIKVDKIAIQKNDIGKKKENSKYLKCEQRWSRREVASDTYKEEEKISERNRIEKEQESLAVRERVMRKTKLNPNKQKFLILKRQSKIQIIKKRGKKWKKK